MAKICIAIHPLTGPINAIRKLVGDLRENGHTVHYIGHPGCERYMKGESFFSFFQSLAGNSPKDPNRARSTLLGRLRHDRASAKTVRQMLKSLIHGDYQGFNQFVEEVNPDLIIIESTSRYAAMWGLLAHRFGVPTVLINSSLTAASNPVIPPISSKSAVSQTLMGRIRTRLEWKRLAVRWRLRKLYPQLLGLDYDELVKELVLSVNFPLHLLTEHESCFLRRLGPELVLFPKAFDFECPTPSGRHYTAATVDMERPEVSFPWERLSGSRRLIYCSLGSMKCLRPEQYRRFYDCVLEAFQSFADRYQLVLAVGDHYPAARAELAPGVIVVKTAPQLALLKHAAVMITHGGANSVRECISLGVPMLFYPIALDGPGLGARAEFHGLGLMLKQVSAKEMKQKLHELLTVSYYRLNARRMQKEFTRAEGQQSPVQMIETFLGTKPESLPDCARIFINGTLYEQQSV